MKKITALALLILSVATGTVVFAQDSPFSSLTDGEPVYRLVESPEGQTLENYTSLKKDYFTLKEAYEVSYGPRKIELEQLVFARAQDVLLSKLGAMKTYLLSLKEDMSAMYGDAEALPPILDDIDAAIVSHDEATQGFVESVEAATTVAELRVISRDMATSLKDTMYKVWPHVADLSLYRGKMVVAKIDERAPVLQAHMDAAEALGSSVGGVRGKFDGAMLRLEDARDEYQEVEEILAGTLDQNALGDLRGRTMAANSNLRRAYDGLSEVMSDLKKLYGSSPWEIDSLQFPDLIIRVEQE